MTPSRLTVLAGTARAGLPRVSCVSLLTTTGRLAGEHFGVERAVGSAGAAAIAAEMQAGSTRYDSGSYFGGFSSGGSGWGGDLATIDDTTLYNGCPTLKIPADVDGGGPYFDILTPAFAGKSRLWTRQVIRRESGFLNGDGLLTLDGQSINSVSEVYGNGRQRWDIQHWFNSPTYPLDTYLDSEFYNGAAPFNPIANQFAYQIGNPALRAALAGRFLEILCCFDRNAATGVCRNRIYFDRTLLADTTHTLSLTGSGAYGTLSALTQAFVAHDAQWNQGGDGGTLHAALWEVVDGDANPAPYAGVTP